MSERIRVGDRVTEQPDKWHDGTPVNGWPDPQLVGRVTALARAHGVLYARIRWERGGGETSHRAADRLLVIPPTLDIMDDPRR